MIGRVISHYRIIEKLGEGGMGVVWKAHDEELGRFAAIKSLAVKLSGDAASRARFFQEARAASALNHPNIVTIYDLFHEDGVSYLVMEFVQGKPLNRLIPPNGMQHRDLLPAAIQIAGAVSAAHKAGIVHRDLKPGNIMITPSGQVKVLDFGLAKQVGAAPISASNSTVTMRAETEDGTVLGTVSYMSPEQAEGKAVDTRSDIFSFGSVLYEMTAGRPAFGGESKVATMAAILREETPPLRDVPRELEKIVQRCLRKDPERRAQSIGDVKLALEELKEEAESGRSETAPAFARKKRPVWVWPAAAFAVAVVAGLGWKFYPREVTPAATLITVTSYEGIEDEAALSPEGKQVVFVWDGDDGKGQGIFVKLVGGGRPLRITAGQDSAPRWSPDGQLIAFARSGAEGGYFTVPGLGGQERRFHPIVANPKTVNPGLDWTPDGKSIVIVDGQFDPPSLALIPFEGGAGGAPARLTTPPAETYGDGTPRVSPDGRSIAFIRALNTGGIYDVRIASFAGGRMTVDQLLHTAAMQAGGLCWTKDSREILLPLQYQGGNSLVRLSVDANRPLQQVPGTADAVQPASALHTARIAFTHRIRDSNLWRMALIGADAGKSERVLGSTRPEFQPEYSPDGTRIAFVSQQTGAREIWVANADGSNSVQLTSNLVSPLRPRWSPDGRTIVFAARPGNNVDVYSIPSAGGAAKRLTTHPLEDSSARFSRDGKWVYFSSTRTGRLEIFKVPADGSGPEIQITREGGQTMAESPDGRDLYYVKSIPGLWKKPTAGGPEIKVLDIPPTVNWNFSGERILAHDGGRIRSYDTATGTVSDAVEADPGIYGLSGLSVTPDGKWMLYSRVDQNSGDILVLDNFR